MCRGKVKNLPGQPLLVPNGLVMAKRSTQKKTEKEIGLLMQISMKTLLFELNQYDNIEDLKFFKTLITAEELSVWPEKDKIGHDERVLGSKIFMDWKQIGKAELQVQKQRPKCGSRGK